MKEVAGKKGIYAFKYNFSFKNTDENGKPKTEKSFFTESVMNKEAYKEYLKIESTIKFKDTEFQADPISINFMSAVLSTASVEFNSLLAQGVKPDEAFEKVYGQEIDWKDVQNKWVKLKVSELGQGLQLALINLKKILSES